jgi:hypothetical protein
MEGDEIAVFFVAVVAVGEAASAEEYVLMIVKNDEFYMEWKWQ